MIDDVLFRTNCPYFFAFRIDDKDKVRLLNFKKWQIEEECIAQIDASDYAPSSLWKGWLRDTHISVNNDSVLVKSGHSFRGARQVTSTTLRSSLGIIRRLVSDKLGSDISNDEVYQVFLRMYGKGKVVLDEQVLKSHPNPYLRYLEAMILSCKRETLAEKTVLEIGAGAGVSIVERERNGGPMQYIIDLPDTIEIAFVYLLQFVDPDLIALPNEVPKREARIIFALPNQAEERVNQVDWAFNMASLQEMTPQAVNSYIELLGNKVKDNGFFISVNQERSRHIDGNEISGWNLAQSGFGLVGTEVARLQDVHHKANGLVLNTNCNVYKKTSGDC